MSSPSSSPSAPSLVVPPPEGEAKAAAPLPPSCAVDSLSIEGAPLRPRLCHTDPTLPLVCFPPLPLDRPPHAHRDTHRHTRTHASFIVSFDARERRVFCRRLFMPFFLRFAAQLCSLTRKPYYHPYTHTRTRTHTHIRMHTHTYTRKISLSLSLSLYCSSVVLQRDGLPSCTH